MAHRYSTRAAPLVWALVTALTGCAKHVPLRPPDAEARSGGGATTQVSGLDVQLEERFYPVSGLTPTTLNSDLARIGPTVRGRKSHAVTEWRVSWSYVPVRRGVACASSRAKVTVHVMTTLPRWLDVERAPEGLANDWALFLERLRHHESEHQDIAMKYGRELLSVLNGLEAGDCALLETVAERIAAGVTSTHEAKHRTFDASTDYGLRPGER